MRTCAICGCTDDQACRPLGCAWVSKRPAVCSACFTFLMNVRDQNRVARLMALCGLCDDPGPPPHPETTAGVYRALAKIGYRRASPAEIYGDRFDEVLQDATPRRGGPKQ